MRDALFWLLRRREAGIAVMIVLVAVVVSAIEPRFATRETLGIIALAIPLIVVVAMGQMMALVARHVDLSVGSIMAFSAIVAGMMFRDMPDLPILVPVLAAIGLGAALGLVNGLLITMFNLHSIIVTLGTMSLYRGLVFWFSDARQVDPQFIPRVLTRMSQTSPFFGIPWIVILALLIAIAAHLFLSHSRVGRQIYALGSNPTAAPLRGIRVVPVTLMVFTISGALCGIAGIFYASRFGYVNPGITGQGFEFTVIAAVVVGGVSINGGQGTVVGTLFGVLLLGMVSVALPLLRVSGFWQEVFNGSVIVIALLVDVAMRERTQRAQVRARLEATRIARNEGGAA